MIILTLLTKMIACSGILFGYYWLFLRNKKFHHYNRFYLLAATCMSIVFPFVRIPVSFDSDTATAQFVTKSIAIISVNRWEEEITESPGSGFLATWFTLPNILFILYCLIAGVLLYILMRSLVYIRRLSKKYPCEQASAFKLYNTTEPGTPFSFFKSIFWNSRLDMNSREGQQIFRHELFHVKQQHSTDIIFLELVSIFCWINPFFHLIKKEIKAIHEFLADQHAIDDHNQQAYAELLILQTLRSKKSPISNYFFQNHIKRRIAMITQFKSKTYSYWSRLLVLPLGIFLFCAVALYAQKGGLSTKKAMRYPTSNHATESIKVVVDAGHGGTDAGVLGHGLQEKDISLAIAKQIKQHASSYNIEVVMTREADNYAPLKERSTLAADVKADMVVSIHVGGAEDGSTPGGFDIYITNRNQETLAKSKLLGQTIADQIKDIYSVGPIKQRKEKGIWILDAVPAPAVLIECGYMTNEQDVAFITNTKNQEQLAKKILDGIVQYQSNKGVTAIDTIPKSKKARDSVSIQLRENDAEAERKIAVDKQIQAQRQEAERARLQLTESRIKMQKQSKEIEKQQNDLKLKESKLSRDKMSELERKNQSLAKQHREIEARQLQQMKLQENAALAREKDFESRQRVLEEKIQRQSDDLARKTEELEARQHLVEQKHIEEMQKRQHDIVEKQQELELKRQEIKEAEIVEIQRKQQMMMEIQTEKQAKQHKLQEQQSEKAESPAKKKSPDKSSKPKPAQKAND